MYLRGVNIQQGYVYVRHLANRSSIIGAQGRSLRTPGKQFSIANALITLQWLASL